MSLGKRLTDSANSPSSRSHANSSTRASRADASRGGRRSPSAACCRTTSCCACASRSRLRRNATRSSVLPMPCAARSVWRDEARHDAAWHVMARHELAQRCRQTAAHSAGTACNGYRSASSGRRGRAGRPVPNRADVQVLRWCITDAVPLAPHLPHRLAVLFGTSPCCRCRPPHAQLERPGSHTQGRHGARRQTPKDQPTT